MTITDLIKKKLKLIYKSYKFFWRNSPLKEIGLFYKLTLKDTFYSGNIMMIMGLLLLLVSPLLVIKRLLKELILPLYFALFSKRLESFIELKTKMEKVRSA